MNDVINKLKKMGIVREIHDDMHGYEVDGDKIWHGIAQHKQTGELGFVIAIESHVTNLRFLIILTKNEINYLKSLKNDIDKFIQMVEGGRREVV